MLAVGPALRRELVPGERLEDADGSGSAVYLIESGRLDLCARVGERLQPLTCLGSGDLVGEGFWALGGGGPLIAMAITPAVVLRIDPDHLSDRVEAADPIVRALIEAQAKRLSGFLGSLDGAAAAPSDSALTSKLRIGQDKIRLELQLREALARSELELSLQPIVHLRSGEIVGHEALVRWNHRERGAVSPEEFIALAEETSLIVPIGERIFDLACGVLTRWETDAAMAGRYLAVNVSARQALDASLPGRIGERLAALGIAPQRLRLEITETLAPDYRAVATFIAHCHEVGLRVALDDFGTGYANLGQLPGLKFDALKIDQSLSLAAEHSTRAAAIVRAIVLLGQALGAEVIAEGIERQSQCDALQRLGCAFGQGFLLGRPLAASNVG